MELFKCKKKLDSPLVEGINGQVLAKDEEGKNVWKSIEGFTVIDNLESTDSKSGLSANQGRVLNNKIETEKANREASIIETNNSISLVDGKTNSNSNNINVAMGQISDLTGRVDALNDRPNSEVRVLGMVANQTLSKDVFTILNIESVEDSDFIVIKNDGTNGLCFKRKAGSGVRSVHLELSLATSSASNISVKIKKNGTDYCYKGITSTTFLNCGVAVPIDSDDDYFTLEVSTSAANTINKNVYTNITVTSFR